KEPVAKRTGCDLLSRMRGSPSLYHSMDGSGLPSALQCSVSASSLGTTTFRGCSVIRGGRD
ncbi:MAG: hypothetical protein Q8869_02945, partial [Candidatus Phytoplasma australasiaticum]|nr:hypothetical protein [Candidatus Phytoplasma australasiaticum]